MLFVKDENTDELVNFENVLYVKPLSDNEMDVWFVGGQAKRVKVDTKEVEDLLLLMTERTKEAVHGRGEVSSSDKSASVQPKKRRRTTTEDSTDTESDN